MKSIHTLPLWGVLVTLLLGASLTGCGKTSDNADKAPVPMTVGGEIDDSVITASVKSALLADPAVKGFDVKVETRKGEVQLSGFVDDKSQIDRAGVLARAVSGVTSLQNGLSLKGSANTVGENVDDVLVTTRVKTALLADPKIKSLDINVVTRKGDAQLSGFVNSQAQIDRAVEIAKGAEGVHTVHNELILKK